MTPHLFVYGTLMPGIECPMGTMERNKLRSAGDFLGAAHTHGTLLNLGAYPGMIEAAGTVHGGLYRLHDPASTLAWLDAYEGLTGNANDEYVRREVKANLANGETRDAWTYVFIGSSLGLCKISTGRWQTPPA
ncbi:MAG: gamma-glutamylcyclotransferase family protein [Hyphomicrobiaceae bacterium]